MVVTGKIIKCAMFWKRMTVERNGRNFGTRDPRYSLCRVLFRWGHLSSVWDHSVHCAKFPMSRLSRGYCPHRFHPISTILYGKHDNQAGIQTITCFGNLPKIKHCCTLFFFLLLLLLTQDHMGLEISKRYSSYSFRPMSATLWGHWLPWGNIGCYLLFLAIRLSYKHFVTLCSFSMGANGKIQNVQYLENGWP